MLAVSYCFTLRGLVSFSVPPQPCLPLTGLLELLLVIMQGLVVMHADSAHLDLQLLGHWLLAAGRDNKRVLGNGPAQAASPQPGTKPTPNCLAAEGLLAPF